MNESTPRKVGDVVYPPYRPQKLGLVHKVSSDTNPWERTIVVLWKDGTSTEESAYAVKRYDDLIEDHARKLKNHQIKKAEFLEYMQQ